MSSSGRSCFSPWARAKEYSPVSLSILLRSEEHTSELQSRLHLVCRLLLEKKKKIAIIPQASQDPYLLAVVSRNTSVRVLHARRNRSAAIIHCHELVTRASCYSCSLLHTS